ncbi:tetratricopeptide repeat protein [Thalassovita mediterranea]|nr:tetratricopeptide repeat protein [Thalassovita mediterranea]
MGFKTVLKSAVIVGAMSVMGAGAAMAQGANCEATEFSSTTGELYLKAETELLQNDNPQAALSALNQLRNQELNCYEQGAILKLGAAIKIEAGDYAGAVRDLEQAINQGYIPASERKNTYYNIFQIYLSQNNLEKALEYSQKWTQAGGTPDRDGKWQLAVVNQKLGRNQEALRWAEEVFRTDGPNAERQVYDFLIFLYDETGQRAKKAELLETLLARNPNERRLWDAIAGDYFAGEQERKAFEVQKAMYLGGILTKEDEIMRIVNFYNRFNAPYQAAQVLEKEMNAGRVSKTYERMELLANLYQVAREFDRAIPVIEEAARMNNSGAMYERLGRSYAELQEWAEAEEALTRALNTGGVQDRGLAWVLIGQSRYERGDRAGAREAFSNANNRGGRGWLDFMRSEEQTEAALVRFEAQSLVQDTENEKRRCEQLAVLGEGNAPEACSTVDERLAEARAEFQRISGS